MMKNILDQPEKEEISEEEWRLFVGPNSDYFVREWQKKKADQPLSFNVSAFFFNIFWLLYRQMFRNAVLVLSIFFAEGYLENLFFRFFSFPVDYEVWQMIRIMLFSIALGYFGNWLYLRYATLQIQNIKHKHPLAKHTEVLGRAGGASFLPVFLFLLFLMILILVNQFAAPLGRPPSFLY